MLGSASEAEDIVQNVWVRLEKLSPPDLPRIAISRRRLFGCLQKMQANPPNGGTARLAQM